MKGHSLDRGVNTMFFFLYLFAEGGARNDRVIRVPYEHEGRNIPLTGPHSIGRDVGVMGNSNRLRLGVLESPNGKAVRRSRKAFNANVGFAGHEEIVECGPTAKDWEKQPGTGTNERLCSVAERVRPAFGMKSRQH